MNICKQKLIFIFYIAFLCRFYPFSESNIVPFSILYIINIPYFCIFSFFDQAHNMQKRTDTLHNGIFSVWLLLLFPSYLALGIAGQFWQPCFMAGRPISNYLPSALRHWCSLFAAYSSIWVIASLACTKQACSAKKSTESLWLWSCALLYIFFILQLRNKKTADCCLRFFPYT